MALSKEEKKAKKEAKKLEKLRAEVERKKNLRRAELQREMAAQASRKDELEKNWRDIMLKIKEPVFKQDIQIMWHTFERAYDKKDHLINHTIKLINVADDQFQRTISSFCLTVDTTINKFLQDLEQMSRDNDRRTADLLRYGEDDANKIKADHDAAETHLQLLLYHAKTEADNRAWNTRGENMVKEDEERTKYTDIREDLRSFLEDTFNAMWDEYKSVLRNYVLSTADNQKHVRRLRRKENLMADIIATQAKKIDSNELVLKRLRTELQAYESGSKQAVFRDRRDRHRAAWFKLKQRLIEGCAEDDRQINILVKAADDATACLETAYKKGEKILRLARLCRKFETRREKVLPFDTDIPELSTVLKTNVRRQQSDDSVVTSVISNPTGLSRLWQRIAKAELTKRALLREKELLEQENALISAKIAELQDPDTSGLKSKECTCNFPTRNKKDIMRPVAIDGSTELNKYCKYW